MTTTHERIFERVQKAMNDLDFDALEAVLTEDYVEEYPQSGEIVRGRANARAIRERYPGGVPEQAIDSASTRVGATGARWLRGPAYTLLRAEGTESVGTAAFRARYPDGSTWWIVILYELRGERIARATYYFAPVFEAPEWRKPYVETGEAPAGH